MRTAVNIITHFVGLLSLRNKPQNLTYSMHIFALLFLLLVFILKLTLQNFVPQLKETGSVIPIFIIIYEGFFLAILFFMLTKAGKKNRFVQSACNFLGVNIISCIITSIINFLPFQLLFICLVKSWLLIINLHITKHAFAVDFIRAIYTYLFMNAIALLAIILPFIIFMPVHKIAH